MKDTKRDTGIRIEIVEPRPSAASSSLMLNKSQMRVPERSETIVEQPSASHMKPRERLLHIGVRIPATLLDEIDAEAREKGCSMSQIIRERLQLAPNLKYPGKSDAHENK